MGSSIFTDNSGVLSFCLAFDRAGLVFVVLGESVTGCKLRVGMVGCDSFLFESDFLLVKPDLSFF